MPEFNKPPVDFPVVDARTGKLSPKWAQWFDQLQRGLGLATPAGSAGQLMAVNTDETGLEPFSGASLTIAVGGILGSNPLLHVRDEEASGTAGGDFNSGAWRTRTLNTEKTNQIAGASLSANQITLPAGTYWLYATAPGTYVDAHKLKVANITDVSDLLVGNGSFNPSTFAQIQTSYVSVMGLFTLAAQKVIALQHRCQTTRAGNGFGNSTSFGVVEVYAEVMIWQLAKG